MQQLLRVMRGLVYPAAAIFLLWAGYQIIASPYVSEKSGKILAVYDGDLALQDCNKDIAPDEENQSEQALAGFCDAASKSRLEVDLLNVHAEVHDQADGRSSRIYQQLASRVARGPVLGVISFLTSPDSPPVVRFCRTMQIPLLLALAANDNLMAPAEDTPGIVFRMIPTNGRQAKDMADWLQQQLPPLQQRHPNQKFLRTALFHEPNSFGEFLHRRLTQELQPQVRAKEVIVYNFEVTDQVEFADLMPQLWCDKMDLIIYLGFRSRALDLVNKLRSYKADLDQVPCDSRHRSRSFDNLTVLLCDGAYQDDLNDEEKYKFPFNVFAMLPTRPGRKDEPNIRQANALEDKEETGPSAYGYDSYALLEQLAKQRFRIPSQPIEHPKTGHEFRFDAYGELTPADQNRYRAYLLRSSPDARQP
jgi:hypothetical protein